MNWFLIAWLLALTFITCHGGEWLANRRSLRLAWGWLAVIPFSHFAMALFRVANYRHPQDMSLIGIWSNGFEWLFLGLSVAGVARALRK